MIKTFIKTCVITFIVIFGIGYWLIVPNKAETLKRQQISKCIKENLPKYQIVGAFLGENRSSVIHGANEQACRDKYK